MPWPTGSDYQQATQNAEVAFRDAELKAAHPELDKLGMPKPRSGSFAVAFKMQCTGRDYAVRCFLKEAIDRQERYRLIQEFLDKAKLPYAVEFQYQREGILAHGAWRPILKMEWVHGDTLGAFVAKNVHDARNLLELAGRWVEMTQALNNAGMAHGDLQHGNVMVMPTGQLKLIDYDGMYVPALAGRPSNEDGHRNYQHPLRSALDYGPKLDHFSEWVIYVSLVMLSLDPTLWVKLKGGDECLLFRQADFDPATSPALQVLDSSRDERVRSLASAFRTLLYFGVSQIPLIDARTLPLPEPATVFSGALIPVVTPPGASWIADHVAGSGSISAPIVAGGALANIGGASALVPAASAAAPVEDLDASWILSMIGPAPAPARFTSATRVEWSVLLVSGVGAGSALTYADVLAPALLAAIVIANLILWWLRYRRQEIVQRAGSAGRLVADHRRQVAACDAQGKKLERDKMASAQLLQQRLNAVGAERAKIQAAEAHEGEKPRAQLKLTIETVNQARKKLAEDDSKELKRLQAGIGGQLMAAQRDLAGVDQTQLKELASALEALRNAHLQRKMESAYLARARVPGIGPGRVANLRAAGVNTAADMKRRGLYGISGIGPTLQGSLLSWANAVEADAMRTRPMSLAPDAESYIRSKYSQQRSNLTTQRDVLQKRMAAEQQRISAAHQPERDALNLREQAAQLAAATELTRIHGQYASRYVDNDQQTARAQLEHVDRLAKIGQAVAAQRTEFARLRWQLAKLQHDHSAYARITFPNYVRRTIWPFAA